MNCIKFTFFIFIILLLPLSSCSNPDSKFEKIPPNTSIIFPLDAYKADVDFAIKNSNFDGQFHAAEDMFVKPGTSVFSIADGQIAFSDKMGGYGWLTVIEHPDLDVYSLYGHLSTRRDKMTEGAGKKGQIIGYIGDEDEIGSQEVGFQITPHLHFGIRRGKVADYPEEDSSPWMAGYTRMNPGQYGWLDPTDFILRKL